MKSRILFTVLIFLSTLTFAQKMGKKNLEQRVAAIEDKMAIKYVVDEFSNLADTKEIEKQVMLFTEDGEVVSISGGKPSTPLKGRKQLQQAFSAFLSNFHTVYHQNAQQTIDLHGDKAEATSYCRVILVGNQNGKESKTTLYTIYKDSFVKENGKWWIKHRTSNFVHREQVDL
ncbi:nuclear transport factor 2 family protein [Pedobacter antarcticus]|uniref:nuclear transport factor 2 family protein n=1 Tax=Pedobacter antarcticus TaxID=34086 RepID=UPI000880DAAB|nr:nuclear transport factor 2 family protein [Pedobacter antarcticus]SDM61196.1 SnoaL-like domain-containing protein [Pedobacter antarcticus]